MQSRTNLIMSHGGRHGAGGTYLRGTKLDRETSENVPNRHLTGNSREAWAGAPPERPRAVSNLGEAKKAAESPDAKALQDAVKKDEAAEAAKKAAADAKPKPPTSKRQITVMRKGELVTMAEAYEVESSGTADDIRTRLRDRFFGEDEHTEE